MTLAAVYLYVILHDDNSQGERFRTRMPDMETCLSVLEHVKTSSPSEVGGDYEALSVVWCGGDDFQRNYNATWWRDEVESSD